MLGTFCTDFNTRNHMGSPKESLEKKNIFAEKYDEIRRLDGIL